MQKIYLRCLYRRNDRYAALCTRLYSGFRSPAAAVSGDAGVSPPEMPAFTIHEYQPLIDSSDMTPQDWQAIAEDIRQNYDLYDGFVILHGTDTMAFTASALSLCWKTRRSRSFVTGSQIPLAELRSDGQQNLLNALFVAANYPVKEVSLFFNNTLYRGNRTTKAHADGFNAFASPNLPPLLEAGIHIRRLNTPPAPQRWRSDRPPYYAAAYRRRHHLSRHLCGSGAQLPAPAGEGADPALLRRWQCAAKR